MVRRIFFTSSILLPALVVLAARQWPPAIWLLAVIVPIILLGLHDVIQTKHALLRIFPVIGHGRYLMEEIRPEIQQYFVENNIDGAPYSREHRSQIYQRAKGQLDTVPFGTQRDVEREGYEQMAHSIDPAATLHEEPRVRMGGPDCAQPYDASRLNISAMSFGSLGKTAVMALNEGARRGGFAHNTGEGGISPYHLEPGGDLIWQVGTGYFGARAADGGFDPDRYRDNAQRPTVKAVELKLSQGAKPGHGGILPAAKLTEEIAGIRGIPMGQDVLSPPGHSAFDSPTGLLEFLARLRDLSGGKPVGFKLCVGRRSEFLGICRAMEQTGITPDFITIDGSEGGTGAAPLEFSNSVGLPLREGLRFAHNALVGFGVRDRIRIVAAGKISTAFHIFKAIALGADLCNSARGMMFALGCIQARVCNTNRCPVGLTTQDPSRMQALHVPTKAERVASYHRDTIHTFLELVAAAGLEHPTQIGSQHVLRRVDPFTIKPFCDVYPCLEPGTLLHDGEVPERWQPWMAAASADRFRA